MDPIQRHAAERPDAPALVLGDRTVTWTELDRRANQVARALAADGIEAADRVAVSLRNSIEFFELLCGAGRLGAMVLPVPFRAKRDEAEYLIADARAEVVVAEPANAEEYAGLPHTVFRGDPYDAWVAAHHDGPLENQVGAAPAPMRFYTSGTTGRPKALARRTERRDASGAMAEVMNARLGALLGPGEVYLLAAVMYHTAPGAYAGLALNWGHTIVITDHFDAEEALALIERHRVTWTQMAPIHLVRIGGLSEQVARGYDLSSMKRLLHAGAPCPVDVKWKMLDLFPPGVVYEYYAATEGYATECPEELWRRKPGTVGKPVDGIRILVLDDDGHELGANQVGQVYIDNGSDFEYEGDSEKTAQTWRGDAFSVGDMGFLDEDGFLFLTDRKSHMIISGGANIYPAEIENVLFSHPAVADCAVFGVPDEQFGEQVKAVVERRGPATEEDLVEFCRQRLAHYKCPRSVDFVETMPRDPNGKIRKHALREPYWEGHATRVV